MKKVAIQGIKGSFHYQVATELYGKEIEIVECMSFSELADQVSSGKVDEAVMALENTIAGAILPNYSLIGDQNLYITGEYYLDIVHNLMVLSGQTIEDIKEVHSHPMALLQCKKFFKKYPKIKLVEDVDTAETARRIHEQNLKGIGAIASKSASELFQLEILAKGIQTMDNNATRFVVVKKRENITENKNCNKASLEFQVHHKRGSLATVLNVISDCQLNMTKIQSLPVIETPWKYAFFLDVTFEKYEQYAKAVQLLKLMTEHFTILGEYKNALI